MRGLWCLRYLVPEVPLIYEPLMPLIFVGEVPLMSEVPLVHLGSEVPLVPTGV